MYVERRFVNKPGCLYWLKFFEESSMVLIQVLAFYFRDYPVRKDYAVAINVGNLRKSWIVSERSNA